MTKLIFGFDNGTKSIGWAVILKLVSGAYLIIDCGVFIFSDGMFNEKGRYSTVTGQRRDARQSRRQTYRTRRRMKAVANAIRKTLYSRFDPTKMPNPIYVRGTGKGSVHEFAAAIYHIAGRRGFKSNAIPAPIVEPATEHPGEEMYRLVKSGEPIVMGTPTAAHNKKRSQRSGLDTRSNERPPEDHLKAEFDALWDKAGHAHPEFTPDAKAEIRRLIFHRRDLKPCDELVGQCEYMPAQKRAAKDDPDFQRFRIRADLSNIKIITDDGEIKKLTDYPDALAEMTDELMTGQNGITWKGIERRLNRKGVIAHILSKGQEKEGRKAIEPRRLPDPDGKKAPRANISREAAIALYDRMVQTNTTEAEAKQSLLADGVFEEWKFNVKWVPITGKMMPIEELEQWWQKIGDPTVKVIYGRKSKLLAALVAKYGLPDYIQSETARQIGKGNKAYVSADIREAIAKRREAEHRQRIANRKANGGKPPSTLQRLKNIFGDRCFFSGTLATEIGHLLPVSKNGDAGNDQFFNLVPISARINRLMGNMTPFEFMSKYPEYAKIAVANLEKLEKEHPDHYKAIVWRFDETAMQSFNRGFRSKDLNQCRDAEKMIRIGLSSVCHSIGTVPGGLTAIGRRQYGIRKNRKDHRHHATDAIIIALAPRKGDKFPTNVTRFDIESATDNAIGAHRVSTSKSGALHEDGARKGKGISIWRGNHYRKHAPGGNWATEIYDVNGEWQAVTITRFAANQKGFRAGATFRPTRSAKLVMRVFINNIIALNGRRVTTIGKDGKSFTRFIPDPESPTIECRVKQMSQGSLKFVGVHEAGKPAEMDVWSVSTRKLQFAKARIIHRII